MTGSDKKIGELQSLLDSADEKVRQRAEIVVDALRLGSAAAASRNGVSRKTASEWLRRYRERGVQGLAKPAHADLQHRLRSEILSAPLWMPTTKWSSRSIATSLGVSQSAVARVWQSTPPAVETVTRAAHWSGDGLVALAGMLISPAGSILVFRRAGNPSRVAPATRARRSYRAVFAADLARPQIIDDGQGLQRVGAFWEEVASGGEGDGADELLALTSTHTPLSYETLTRISSPTESQWLGLSDDIAALHDERDSDNLEDLETRLRRWFQSSENVFAWLPPAPLEARHATSSAGEPARSTKRAPERVVEDDIVSAIRRGVADGHFTGGDAVTERYLADHLRTTRGQIRAALRLLADDGLVTIDTNNGATVPIPTVADVVELYAARRALGSVAVTAALQWTEQGRGEVEQTLVDLEECARLNDMEGAHLVDQRFQNAVAHAAKLWRIPGILQSLSQQLIMYFTVLGVRYAFPIEDIVTRDREIYDAIVAADPARAVTAWQTKINESASYMVQQLEHYQGDIHPRR